MKGLYLTGRIGHPERKRLADALFTNSVLRAPCTTGRPSLDADHQPPLAIQACSIVRSVFLCQPRQHGVLLRSHKRVVTVRGLRTEMPDAGTAVDATRTGFVVAHVAV